MLDTIWNELPQFFTYYNLIFLLKAFLNTFLLSALGCVIGALAGFLIAVGRNTSTPALFPLRVVLVIFIEIFRRVPFLVTLMLAFFLFQSLRLNLSMFSIALITVCLIGSAYIAEIVRSGLDSVHSNQWDAAYVMNFSYLQTLRYVIIPQAWKIIFPPIFSFFILFIKDTALASQIGVLELTYAGKVLNNKGFSAVLVFGTILALYFLLSYPLAKLGHRLEKKLATTRNR